MVAFLIPRAYVFSIDENIQINLEVVSTCGNGNCEPQNTENETNCPADCGCNNNGICDTLRGESSTNCPIDCLVTPLPPGGGGIIFDTTPPIIFNLFISKITLNSAALSWETNEQAVCHIFLGRTSEYKDAVISETEFKIKHLTTIVNLLSTNTYHFKIVCNDTNRNESETLDQQFTTLTPPDIIPPANVINFSATPGDETVTLAWKNPPDSDFKAVKIMRDEKFYPTNPREGTMVYNDKGVFYIDKGLKNDVLYYYTAFAYDRSGNYASGAVAFAIPRKEIIPIPPIVPPPGKLTLEEITLKSFDFYQEDKRLPIIDGKIIKAKTEKSLTVSIECEKVPGEIKNFLLTLLENKASYSFLFGLNKQKNVYQTIILLEEIGKHPFVIVLLDKDNQILKEISGEFQIEKEIPIQPPWYEKPQFMCYVSIILIIILLIILIFCFFLFSKKRKQKDEDSQPESPPSVQNFG